MKHGMPPPAVTSSPTDRRSGERDVVSATRQLKERREEHDAPLACRMSPHMITSANVPVPLSSASRCPAAGSADAPKDKYASSAVYTSGKACNRPTPLGAMCAVNSAQRPGGVTLSSAPPKRQARRSDR